MEEGLNFVQQSFANLGLNSSIVRLLVVGAASSAALFYFKPGPMFDENGNPRPWSITCKDEEDQDAASTPVTWWLVSGSLALFSSLFV